MRYIIRLLLAMMMYVPTNMWAQHIIDPMLTQEFSEHVKSIDEFMNRFNGTEAYPGLDKSAPDYRMKNLISLCDRAMKNELKQKVISFAQSIIDNNIHLDYTEDKWYAIAKCDIKFKGKNTYVNLILHPERINGERYRWVFCGADNVNNNLIDVQLKSAISPVEHEIHFMELQSIFKNDRQHIFSYRESNYAIDQLSAFLALAQAGSIEFDQVKDLKFVFMQVPDYIFIVEEKGRRGSNAGWLITSFEAKTVAEKKQYVKKILGK